MATDDTNERDRADAPSLVEQPHQHETQPGWTITEGADVFAACGRKIGEVVAVRGGHLVVEKGFLLPSDLYVPLEAIDRQEEDAIFLTVTRDEIDQAEWDQVPAATADREDGPPESGEDAPEHP